jgi:peptidoglycan/xylan/chitin deacetylase (PgdA/CDA1 family)
MQPIADRAAANASNAAGTGDILCLHDGYHASQNGDRTRTLAALEHWLPRWRDLGLKFATIDQAVTTPAR